MQRPVFLINFILTILMLGLPGLAVGNEPATEVRLATWRAVDVMDPVYATNAQQLQVFDALFQGLVRVEDGNVNGIDAQSWTVSEDGQTYIFTLRDDITWSDGMPVTAHDYQLSFRRMFEPSLDHAAKPTYLLTNIKNALAIRKKEMSPEDLGVTAIDERTLKIELSAPASYFLDILTYPGMVPVPSHLVNKHGEQWWNVRPLVSNGPYVLVKNDNGGKHITLQRRHDSTYPEAPEIAHLIYAENVDDAMRRVINNELDIVHDLRNNEVDWIKDRIGFKQTTTALPSTIYTTFNTLNPKFADKRVRRALFLAIDRSAISRAIDSRPTISFAPVYMLSGAESGLKPESADGDRKTRIQEARALLAEAGYTAQKPLSLTIMKLPMQTVGNTAMALRSMFAQVGIRVTIEEVNTKEHYRRLSERHYEVAAASWMADYNDAMTFYGILETGAQKNYSSFRHRGYDALLQAALSQRDVKKRREIYVQLENIIREEVPIVPIAHSQYTIIMAPTIASIGRSWTEPSKHSDQKVMISIYQIRVTKGE